MARVTLKMIAEEAGVSIATVSMALRGQGKLAKANMERINAIAARLGYTPDPVLASLASKRFRAGEAAQGLPMALLEFPPHAGDQLASVNQYRKDLKLRSEQLGYAPQVYSVEEMRRYQDFRRLLYHRGTVAIVISGQPEAELFANPERWQSFALAQCGRYQSILPLHTVRPNIFQAIQLAFNKAYDRGYRRIAFIISHHPEVLEDDLARYGSAMAFTQTRLPQACRIPPFFGAMDDMDGAVNWVRKHAPDAVIAFNDVLWYKLKDAGLRIPQDFGFISLHIDNGNLAGEIAGLNQSRAEIAYQTVLLLDQMVRHNERGIPNAPRNVLIPSTWIEGCSLPRRPAS